jgi:hypothetical protein
MAKFGYLLRFKTASNETWYGEVPEEIVAQGSYVGSKVPVYSQNEPWDSDFHLLDRRETVSEVCVPCRAASQTPQPSSIAINTVHTGIIASKSRTNLRRRWIELQASCRGSRSKLAVVRGEIEADRANSSAHQMKITPYPVIFNKPAGQLAYCAKI